MIATSIKIWHQHSKCVNFILIIAIVKMLISSIVISNLMQTILSFLIFVLLAIDPIQKYRQKVKELKPIEATLISGIILDEFAMRCIYLS